MDLSYVRSLYIYNHWANDEILNAVSALDTDQIQRPLGSSFPSVRDTLVHLAGAEWIWLERWLGRSPRTGLPTVDELPDLPAIRTRLDQVDHARNQFLAQLTEPDLDQSISYINSKGETWTYPLWQQMAHVANHSTYHRGQVATLLRQLGHKPPMTDLLFYYDQHR